MSDQQEDQASAELAAQLNSDDRPIDAERANAIANEEAEDIDAFLSDLEDDAPPPVSEPAAPAEPDPFADAFADLEASHVDDPEPVVVAAVVPAVVAPAEVTPAEVAPIDAEETRAERKAREKQEKLDEKQRVLAEKAQEKERLAAEKAERKRLKNRRPTKEDADDSPGVVETVRSPGYRFGVWMLKFTLFLIPALVCWWVVGSLAGSFFEVGWIVLAFATLAAFVVPAVPRVLTGWGRYGWWAAGIGLIAVVAIIASIPDMAGKSIARYGHWPATTTSQLAEWEPDNSLVMTTAGASQFIGQRIETLRAPVEVPSTTLALGTNQTIEAHAKSLKKVEPVSDMQKVKDGTTPAPETKPEETPPDEVEPKEKADDLKEAPTPP